MIRTYNPKDMVKLVQTTDLVSANSTSTSLRTTVPREIIRMLGLTEEDKLEWTVDVGENITITVRGLKKE